MSKTRARSVVVLRVCNENVGVVERSNDDPIRRRRPPEQTLAGGHRVRAVVNHAADAQKSVSFLHKKGASNPRNEKRRTISWQKKSKESAHIASATNVDEKE